jgi:hypothetical protein
VALLRGWEQYFLFGVESLKDFYMLPPLDEKQHGQYLAAIRPQQ